MPTSASPPQDRHAELRRTAWWAAPQLLTLGLAIATMPAVNPPCLAVAPTPPPPAPIPPPPKPEPLAVDAPPPPDDVGSIDISALLERLPFEQRTPRGEKQRYSDLISMLRARSGPGVTVINLWSPTCVPCKQEFKLLRELQADWGSDIRFVSIQLGKDDPGDLLAQLPRAALDLHDIGAGDGTIRQVLADLGRATKHAPIPITMVLDCRHRLRWLRTRAIEAADKASFAAFLAERRRETTTLCPAASSEPVIPANTAPRPAASVPRCGDDRCDAGETTEDCCQDCGCPNGETCQFGRGRHICRIPNNEMPE